VRARAAVDIENAPLDRQFDVFINERVESIAPVRSDE